MTEGGMRELLFTSLRARNSGTRDARKANPTREEWYALPDLARRHRVAPLLYRQLKECEAADVPSRIVRELRPNYLQTAAKNMRIYRQMSGILRCFHEAHIPVIPLKGLYLAEKVYGNIAVRPMGDVDILVKEENLSRVEEILLTRGFTQKQSFRASYNENNHFQYTLPGIGLMIEVHWNLLPPCDGIRVDIPGLWDRSRPSAISGITAREMSPEDLLLYICVHASAHVFDMGLRMVCDIVETLLYFENEIDWRRLQQTAREWRATKCLYVGLRLADELFDAPVPRDFIAAIKPENVEPAYQNILRERLFADNESDILPARLQPNIVKFWAEKSLPGKARLLWQFIFPPPEVMAMIYPTHTGKLYRLSDLVKRHGRTVWRLFRNNTKVVTGVERHVEINELRKWLFPDSGR